MKTQISRWTDHPARRLSGVYLQQGRMITDADLNELMELVKRRLDEALGEVVGSGTPGSGGIGLVDNGPKLRRGTIYADGVRARLESAPSATGPDFLLNQQADFPGAPAAPAGTYTLYADLWELATTALHDPAQRDPALHGADTATRTRNLVQVKSCPAAIDPLSNPANPQKGDATLQLEIRQGGSGSDPCDPCAEAIALDARVGNYLFRLEVHDVKGPANAPTEITLKWSSENGAEQYAQADAPTEFKRGDWIYEFYSDTTERHLGVNLAPGFTPARAVLKDGWPEAAELPEAAQLPYVRRWDGYAVLVKAGAVWSIKPGAGGALQAKDKGRDFVGLPAGTEPTHGHFELQADLVAHLSRLKLTLALNTKTFVAGDFWLAAVREDAEGADRVQPVQSTPVGITHHYVVLAKMNADGTRQPASDADTRRLSFPRLSDIPADHVGYDPAPQAARWTDIIDTPPVPAPLNVQRAIDLLLERLDGSDLSYLVPACPSTPSVRSLLGAALSGLIDANGRIKLDQLLQLFLCVMDAGSVPYQTGNATGNSVRHWLDLIPTKVSKAGDTMSGALHIQGGGLHVGAGIAIPGNGNLKVDGNCVIDGDLTVHGNTTTINTSQLEVEDRIIRVNKYAPQATPQVVNGGVEVFRGGTAPNAQVIWDETDDRWKVGVEGSLLPIATGEAQDIVTGVVVFQLMPSDQEMVSQMIDPGHGPGPICVQLGVDNVPAANQTTIGDPAYGRVVNYRAEVDRSTGRFRILATRKAPGLSTARVRWWAFRPRTPEAPLQTVAIAVTIDPPEPTVEVLRTIALVQTVIGTTNQGVTWQVQEGAAGGTITVNGQYTAPNNPGTYHVIARSVADTSKTATVPVVVTPAKIKDKEKEIKEKDIKDVTEKPGEKLPIDTKVKDTIEGLVVPGVPIAAPGGASDAGGRSFIRPEERPDVGLPPH